jgi:hypothetical protein
MGDLVKQGDDYYDELTSLSNAAQSHKGPELQSALSRSGRELEGALDQQVVGREVIGNMDVAKERIVDEVTQRMVRPAEKALGSLRSSREEMAIKLEKMMTENPLITRDLAHLSKTTETNLIKKLNEDSATFVDDLFKLGFNIFFFNSGYTNVLDFFFVFQKRSSHNVSK